MKPNSNLSPFIRACLLVAIIAGSVSTVNVLKLRGRILTLQKSLKAEVAAHENAERALARTQGALNQSLATLEETRAALDKCNGERDQAITEATTQTSRAEQLNHTLKNTRLERDDAKAELARYTNTRMTLEQVITASKTIR